MKLKERIKTYNFWVSIASALFLIINLIGQKFNFQIDESIFNDLFTALCGILVILGIIAPPTKTKNKDESLVEETTSFSSNESQENTELQIPNTNETNLNSENTFSDSLNNEIFDNKECITQSETDDQIFENSEINQTKKTDIETIDIDDNLENNNLVSQETVIIENSFQSQTEDIEVDSSSQNQEASENLNDINLEDSKNLINILEVERQKFSNNTNLYKQLLEEELSKINN